MGRWSTQHSGDYFYALITTGVFCPLLCFLLCHGPGLFFAVALSVRLLFCRSLAPLKAKLSIERKRWESLCWALISTFFMPDIHCGAQIPDGIVYANGSRCLCLAAYCFVSRVCLFWKVWKYSDLLGIFAEAQLRDFLCDSGSINWR